MSESTGSRKRGRTGGCWVALFALLVVVLIAGGAFWYFFLRAPNAAVGPIVHLSFPQTGLQSELNRPIQVTALAQDPAGVTRIELYADGALVAVQETTLAQGSNPLIFMQTWTPLTKGKHILLARGYNRSTQFSDSNAVNVNVVDLIAPTQRVDLDTIPRGPNVPLPSLIQVSQMSSVPSGRLQDANPPLRGIDPTVPLPGGTTIDVPRSPALPPSPETSPSGGTPPGGSSSPPTPLLGTPAAPEGFNLEGSCTSVLLTWVDGADEESYVVYRLRLGPGPAETTNHRIATLPQNSTSYRDTITTPGTYRYQVASVRSGLEGLSPMIAIDTPCGPTSSPPPAGTVNLLLKFIWLQTGTTRYDSAYCYVSINGNPIERVPEYPSQLVPNSREPLRYNLTQLRNNGMVPIPNQPETRPVTLRMECMGRSGLTTSSLGVVEYRFDSGLWNGTYVDVGSVDRFIVNIQIVRDTPEARTPIYYAGEIAPGTFRAIVPTIPQPTNLQYDPNGREACDQLESGGLFGFGERLACAITGRPTITWEWRGTPSMIDGFLVEIDSIAETPRTGPMSRAALVSQEEMTRTSQRFCGSNLNYRVATYLTSGDQPSDEQGVLSLPPCPPAMTGPAIVEVTFDDLSVGGSAAHSGHLEDDDTCIFCTDNRMELFGNMMVSSGTRDDEVDIRGWYGLDDIIGRHGGIGDSILWALSQPLDLILRLFGNAGGVTYVYDPGATFHWSDLPLDTIDRRPTRNQNTMHVLARDGASLTVAINFWDAPTGFSIRSDPYCRARIELPVRTAREWATVNETRTVNQDFGEASCRVTLHITGRAP